MLNGGFPYYLFDELEDDGFADLCNQIISKEYGEEGFVPYPVKGKDGNIDGKHLNVILQKPHFQFKWREIGGGDDTPLRRSILKTFKDYLAEERKHGRSGKLVFITNVRQTAGDIRAAEKAASDYPEFDVEYWGFAKLRHFMIKYDDIRTKLLPVYTSADLRKRNRDLDKREAVANQDATKAKEEKERLRQTAEFQAAALKLKRLHIDWKLLADQYLGFLYLVEPIYVNDQDHVREIIRDLFSIDEPAEQQVIDQLKSDGLIDVTGNVITVTNAKAAAAGTAIVVQHMGADLEKIITLIQGA